MKSIFTFILTASFTLLLNACTTTQSETRTVEQMLAEKGYTLGPAVDRIHRFRVNGWNYLDREHVIVTVSASDRYLIGLRVDCSGLLGAEVIAFTNTVSYLTTFDTLLVRDDTSRILERCPIESMNELVQIDSDAGSGT